MAARCPQTGHLREPNRQWHRRWNCSEEEKRRIAQFAAGLIQPDDFVYLDAGTTTGYILDYLPARSATFVTNAVSHAKRLAAAGNRVILIGGELKGTTEAVIGSQAILTIQGYHFTKGFLEPTASASATVSRRRIRMRH
ncbi:MAG: hypothetical protein ACLTR6_02990 [Clostridium fessum]